MMTGSTDVMANWASGYVVDVDYTHGFYRELAPSYLSFLALIQGIQAPDRRKGTLAYCELGCGQGFSTNVLAAANPQIRFYATDFNPTHTVGAENLARAAQLENVHFFNDSFAEFLIRDDLPAFDFITLHGIYSWISQENRRNIVEFIRRKLKPGGIVYASYNTMPGWASVMPLRRLLVEHANGQKTGSQTARIRDSIAFAERLSQLGSRYFVNHPKLNDRLNAIKAKDSHYVAHEYFNSHLNPFYFIDVAQELEDAKLRWVGPANPLETVDELNLSEEQRKILADIDDIPLRETVRDHIVDQSFRKDLFVKGPLKLGKSMARERWLDMGFALSQPDSAIPTEVKGRGYNLQIQPDFHDALTGALDHKPQSLREIMAVPKVAKYGIDKVIQTLVCLVGQGHCHPCLHLDEVAMRSSHTHNFNKAVATHTTHEYVYSTFASPVTGSGIRMDQIDQMIWLGLEQGEQNLPEFVWRTMLETGHRLARDGKTLSTKEEHVEELQVRATRFQQKSIPLLRTLGIVTDRVSSGTVQGLRLKA
ncbi:methyltransferase regulatory domain-containing protein [Microvirga rosea]|uniref:methyltransferase regulatory domain-containing protein n=1 Tax=Microvirga rosea TaxID=2715425 RepID=UPI001D0B30F6|nr:methyltransferase regulatory domain-containing protein [Microvirga rosea]MCB8821561.1 class I SAM-dependent methyltransferase [Microvirga rosea]